MDIKVTSLSKLSALLLLLEKPRHGYELIKDIRERFGYPVSAGQIYPFLSHLSRAKLVKVSDTGERDKKIYMLTVQGKCFAKNVVDSFEELMSLAISKKIHACAHCGCKVFGKAHTEKIKGKSFLFCCGACAKSFKNR